MESTNQPGPSPRERPTLDAVDRTLVQLLQADARTPNATLAKRAKIAESTCSARVRQLLERGVIDGLHAQVNPEKCGWGIQAMIAVRLAGHDRAVVDDFSAYVMSLPETLSVYNVSGANDFLVHVVSENPASLREFALDHLTGRPGVVQVETSVIFTSEHKPTPLP